MVPYSSADSWKPPIHVSDWLIFSCKMLKKYIKALSNIFYELAPLTCDVICSKL